jgi:hypothetical protein
MCRCVKFVVFCGMAFSQTYKSLYILGVHEDNEMIFMLGFCTQIFFMFSNCEVLILLRIFCWLYLYILFTIHKLG